MRRGLSILLILVFGLGPLSATLEASDDASLPACCRRHGTHHCAMTMRAAVSTPQVQSRSKPTVSAPLTCPNYPGLAAVIASPVPALPASGACLAALPMQAVLPVTVPVTMLASFIRTHAGRGPPAANVG
jgi:hypothetical protein